MLADSSPSNSRLFSPMPFVAQRAHAPNNWVHGIVALAILVRLSGRCSVGLLKTWILGLLMEEILHHLMESQYFREHGQIPSVNDTLPYRPSPPLLPPPPGPAAHTRIRFFTYDYFEGVAHDCPHLGRV